MDVVIRPYEDADEPGVIALWRESISDCAPHNEPAMMIRKKVAVQDGLLFVAEADRAVVGTAMGGYDGHRGWIYSVAVHPDRRRQGLGRMLVARVEAALRERGCLKINLQVRASNAGVVAFYQSLGFEVEERISMGKRLYEESS